MQSKFLIEQALEKFVVQLEANGRSDHTRRQCERHGRLFADWLSANGYSVGLGDIQHDVVAEFLSSSAARTRADGQPKKPTSLNALRTSLRCFFRYAHEAGWVERDPARLLRRARVGPSCPRALTPDEQKRLLATLDEVKSTPGRRDRVLFVLMLRTGLRIGSALALDVGDVDLSEGELRLRRMKGAGEARLPLPREVRPLLADHLRGLDAGPVFRGVSGRGLSQRHAARIFRRYLGLAGIDRVRGCHCLRHTFATDLLRRYGDLALVQKALCHRSITSTMQYIQVDDERLRAALGA